ncbi:MAG: redox-sensitive transcriptional activator SoxR [Pseudomonadota bacterium]
MVKIREISIGRLAERTGLAVSAIRFYEEQGLVYPERNSGGQRRFKQSDIRRLSFVLIAQTFGFSLEQIREQLASLPDGRTPTKADWTRMSRKFRIVVDERIAAMEELRDRLDGCIGCGCLSLTNCQLYNPQDRAGSLGTGPRYVMGDKPGDLKNNLSE